LTGQKGGFSAGAATNAPVAAAGQTPAPGSTGGDDALDEDHAPGVPDVSLSEAEHILMDYLTAMGKINFTAARRE
jgi:hypothetical protein